MPPKTRSRRNDSDDNYESDYETETEYDDDDYDDYDDEEEDDDYEDDRSLGKRKSPIVLLIGDDNINPKRNKKQHTYVKKEDQEYYNSLETSEKKKITDIENSLQILKTKTKPLRFRILESNMDLQTKSRIIEELNMLDNSAAYSSDRKKMEMYIQSLSKLPLGTYKSLPVNFDSKPDDIAKFLTNSKERLNNVVFGHDEAKDKIIKLLAQWISNPAGSGLVLGIDGPMGCGKTTLVKEGICKVLGLPFGFIPLGGVSDGSFLLGHSYTYEGSKCGRICDVLKETGYMNTILYFDELDKVSNTSHGEEIINILIHLTDSTQSDHFCDKYFSNIPIDLSRCLIVFSFNDMNLINPILRDRMTIIKTKEYTISNKIEIAKHYMLPSICKQYGFQANDICISDDVLKYIINRTESEKGVRNFKRSIEEIVSTLNYKKILQEEGYTMYPFKVDNTFVDKTIRKTCNNAFIHTMYT